MNKRKNEIQAILLATIALFVFISLFSFKIEYNISDIFNLFNRSSNGSKPFTGALGAGISVLLKKHFLGNGSYVICTILLTFAYALFTHKDLNKTYYKQSAIYQLFFGIWISLCYAFWYLHGQDSSNISDELSLKLSSDAGIIGYILQQFSFSLINVFGYILIPIGFIIIISGLFNISIYQSIKLFKSKSIFFYQKSFKKISGFWSNRVTPTINLNIQNENEPINTENADDISTEVKNIKDDIPSNTISTQIEENSNELIIDDEKYIEEGDINSINNALTYNTYALPNIELLKEKNSPSISLSNDVLKQKASELVHALETFGVQGQVTRISPGPIITLFEIEPAEGVRVNRFTTLSDDLARVMQAKSIRVIAPIPGTSSVGIELPNEDPKIVYLKNILNSEAYIDSPSKLTIALGKTTSGEAFTLDLAKMPHLLIAGATGTGKSVCINTIIMSIIYKAKPDEVKFILIDPKKLELSNYKKLVGYHLITCQTIDEYVITTSENALDILNSSIQEMERRFELFAKSGVRNVSEYHLKFDKNPNEMEKVPFIIILIDELADLMMTSSRAIEDPITRLAQKARAVGMHLVVATQRPSVDVITGLIKSNFPARISFQVSSMVDSRTIIDQIGSEKLLGNGDLLFLSPGSGNPLRLHNAYITLEEIESVLNFISEQPKPDEIKLPEPLKSTSNINIKSDENHDELLFEAATLIVETRQASVSLLQRKFRIGYSRAGRIIDELESLGIVSGHSGSKARNVLVDSAYIHDLFKK